MIAIPLALLLLAETPPTGSVPSDAPTATSPPRIMGGTLQSYFSYNAYPVAALRHHEQGIVRVAILVSREGSPTRCRIVVSSGSVALDRQTCAVIRARATFHLARDSEGHRIDGIYTAGVNWRLPEQGRH